MSSSYENTDKKQAVSYYLEHCSKTNHIAIKRAKYENVFGLVAH